ncbi:Alpha-1-antiproteinase F [Thelohanellus kitauei]|uniref:Alpha-1-antiproteinase F n=1 Tax=Thelohanellus kitauei TaxID=669202 RepID=A0A0C2MF75_THEKT|nr:Alpha-1-antiproteinase F [Thelohanellus kitauei]
MGAINLGLQGRSNEQLSHFLNEDLDELYNIIDIKHSRTARKFINLRFRAQEVSNSNAGFFSSCYIYKNYSRIARIVFDHFEFQFNISDPKKSTRSMNEWVSGWVHEPVRDMLQDSIPSDNRLVFIYTFNFHLDWIMSFDPRFTKQDIFVDDKNRVLLVPMMNKIGRYRIFDSTGYGYTILFQPSNDRKFYSAIVLPREEYSVNDVLNIFKVPQII